jgi:magnesium transporter
VGRLYGGRVPPICSSLTEYFRDVNDHLMRINAEIDNMRDMLTTATQVVVGLINLNETEVTKKLAAWAAILAVPTLIAGIYGMNFKFIPEYEWQYGYHFSLALMFGVDAILYLWFRKIRWL